MFRVHKKHDDGEEYKGYVEKLSSQDLIELDDWFFNWNDEFSIPDRHVYKLKVEGSDDIQGLISFEYDDGFILVKLIESSPYNRLHEGLSVARPLLAFSCLESMHAGNDGVVCIESKVNPKLIRYYRKIGARYIGSNRLAFFEFESKRLRELYLL